MKNFCKISAATFIAIFACNAFADDLGDTLQKVKKYGVISIGVRDSAVPFNYTVDGFHQLGYSYEVEEKIVEEVKRKLNLPNLKVKELTITGQNRIPLLLNGTIDLECTSTTNNLERQKQVAFSTTMFIIGTRLLVKKNSGIKDWDDLRSRTVAVNAGGTSEKLVRDMSDSKKLDINVISSTDMGQAFMMLESGRAAAYMDDDALLYGERAKSHDPSEWDIVGKPASHEAYGCMLRKDDPQFKKLTDDVITGMMKDGRLNTLYKKWFMQPIPPQGVNINFPMSTDMKALIANPNDKPLSD
ncbi:transporter substrate-binding domain-containing protein [Paraburkholderia tropica]|uniref:transporter substrate-binding domain-containing protein n=1 Tax=Paraburkholderia tropica TaxID=92647 RepID=UPI002AB20340|nr:transporter substrate-binding domain-containing protein [Paraburkholderia tropica]